MNRVTQSLQRVVTKELTTRRSSYDWRAVVGVILIASAYLIARINDLPSEWGPWVKKLDVAAGLLGVLFAVQGRPLVPPPPPADALDERGDA